MNRCVLCGKTAPFDPLYPEHGLVRCADCRLIFFDGSCDPKSLYTEAYFSGGEYLDYANEKAIIQRNFSARIPWLRGLAPSGRLYEIGAAYGFFLDLAKAHWDVKGIEIVPEGVAHARAAGLDVLEGDFLAQPDEEGRYDLICMWDTVEHLPQPVRFIEKAARWLKPGGALVVTTGDIASPVARLRGRRWRMIHPPTHLYYFTPGTLGRAAEQAGLRVTDVRHVGYSRSSKTMAHGLFMLGPRPRPLLHSLFTLGGRLDVPVYLNLYDIMQLTAVKPAAAGAE